MDEYFSNLIEQFKLATGSKNVDITSNQYASDFLIWLKNYQSLGIEYTCFLDYLGFRFTDESCAEVGKGKFDSVVKTFDTLLITTALPIKGVNPERIIKGNMKVFESVPVLVKYIKKGNQVIQISNDIIRTYMTQNPYNQSLITGWEDLHNSGKNNIILGIFGSIHDNDRQTKIKKLKSLKHKLTNTDYIEEYDASGDNYFYVIGSDRIEKKSKVKVKNVDIYTTIKIR